MPLDEKGYGHATVDGWRTTAHRIAFSLVNGRPPDELKVMHACDYRACCNPRHLSVGTQAENLADMRAKGRAGDCRVFGERHGRCRITDQQVSEIKTLRADGMTQQAIADRYGVSQSRVGRILRGENRAGP